MRRADNREIVAALRAYRSGAMETPTQIFTRHDAKQVRMALALRELRATLDNIMFLVPQPRSITPRPGGRDCPNFKCWSAKRVRAEAKRLHMPGYETMSKQELITHLIDAYT